MKQVIAFLIVVVLGLATAFAEPVEILNEEYKFIQLGDYGFPIKVLLEKIGYLDIVRNDKSEPVFDDAACQFLMEYQQACNLEASGMFDVPTVMSVLGVPFVDETIPLVWIAMHGGTKYHTHFDCWNLKEPRAMAIECATEMGYTHCKICYKLSLRDAAAITQRRFIFPRLPAADGRGQGW